MEGKRRAGWRASGMKIAVDGEDMRVTLSKPHSGRRRRTILGRPAALVLVVCEKVLSTIGAAGTASLILLLHVRGGVDTALLALSQELSEDPDNVVLRWVARHLPHIGSHVEVWMAAGLMFWALLLGAEAAGLWYDRGWSEFLIVVETASFLPVEIWGIVARGHVIGVAGLVVNLLILWYVGGLYGKRRRLRQRPPSPAERHPDAGCGERSAHAEAPRR